MIEQRTHGCWRVIERFVVTVELPGVFAVASIGAVLAFMAGRSAAGLLLLVAAALVALIWVSTTRNEEH